jgi:fucose permease
VIPGEQSVLRVNRDAWTRLLYLQLGAFAFFLYAFSPSIGLLKDDLHISAGVAGLHETFYAVGLVFGGVTAPWFIRRCGSSGRAMWVGLLGLCVGIGLFTAVPVLAATLSSAIVLGIFGCYVCIANPAALSRAHGPVVGAAAITEANALAATIGLAAPLAVGGAAALGIGWRTALLAVVPMTGALYLVLGRVREPSSPEESCSEVPSVDGAAGVEIADEWADMSATSGERADDGWRSLSLKFWLNQLAAVCVAGIEFSMTLWCATLLADRTGISHGAAATGVTAVVGGMAAGRMLGGRLALRFPIDHLLYAGFACNVVGFALFWLPATPVAMFAGLALGGLGMSVQFPLTAARGINLAGGRAELSGSVNMFAGGIAVGTLPFALGLMSDRIGIHSAYLLVPALMAIAVVALAASRTPHRATVHVRASETMTA